jgi:hypothetical protein
MKDNKNRSALLELLVRHVGHLHGEIHWLSPKVIGVYARVPTFPTLNILPDSSA